MTLGLSGVVLPTHPQPKPGEIFSSWFCRIAQANGLKLHTLGVQLWGRDKQIWTRDIDRSIDDRTLLDVATAAGTTIERAQETCLRSYEGKLFEKLITNSNSNWILPNGTYHRIRRHYGMQFCPLCLATDDVPYFRKTWRLSLSTFCDLHGVGLHDCCQKCQAPVMFYRQEMGDRGLCRIDSLSFCTTCGFDLKRAAAYASPVVDTEAWNTLRSQLFFIDMGWAVVGRQTFPYPHLYFDVLRNLVQKIKWKKTPGRLLEYAVQRLDLRAASITPGRVSFDFLGLKERHYLLQIATWYMLDWPERFLTACKDLQIRQSEIMFCFESVPYWFHEAIGTLEIKPIGPSEEERAAMRALLQKTNDCQQRKIFIRGIRQRLAGDSLRSLYTGLEDNR